jgi:hypothetical protein
LRGRKADENDIGISVSLSAMPNDVLAATFGVSESIFDKIPKLHKGVIITSNK